MKAKEFKELSNSIDSGEWSVGKGANNPCGVRTTLDLGDRVLNPLLMDIMDRREEGEVVAAFIVFCANNRDFIYEAIQVREWGLAQKFPSMEQQCYERKLKGLKLED